jgi:hypothetical protein
MATYRSGANSRIVIGRESATFNTMQDTPVGHVLRKASFTFDGLKDLIENDELRSTPNTPQDATGRQNVTAQLVMPMTTDELGLLCYYFFGSYAVAGSGPYVHTYKISATQRRSLWIEVADIELTKYDLFNGLFIRSISIGTMTKASQLMKVTVDFWASGKYTLNGGSAQDASPTTYENPLHTMPEASVLVDDSTTALVSEISWTISREVYPYDVLDGTLFAADADQGDYSFDCVMKGWRDSGDTIFGYDDGAEHGVEILSPRSNAATYYVSIDHNETNIFQSEGSGGVSGDGPVMAAVRVRPFYSNHGDASAVVVEIAGEVADYSAAGVIGS